MSVCPFSDKFRRKSEKYYLDEADNLKDLLAPPGNRLEALKGNRAGQHSIRINDQWRICFTWEQPDAYEVEILGKRIDREVKELKAATPFLLGSSAKTRDSTYSDQ